MIYLATSNEELEQAHGIVRKLYSLDSRSDLKLFDANKKRWLAEWRQRLDSQSGKILLLEIGGEIVGVLGFFIGNCGFDGTKTATEAFWYVNESHRGQGLKLLRKFEAVAISLKCKRVLMAHIAQSMPEKLKKVYKKSGYTELESFYMKLV